MEIIGLGIGILVIIVVPLLLWISVARDRRQILEQAAMRYRQLLQHLKQNPTNADLYEQTLAAGRQYSTLTRQSNMVTLYDEVALINDLNAARASASSVPTHAPQLPVSIEQRLTQLDVLKSKGMISDQEYADKRAQILQSF